QLNLDSICCLAFFNTSLLNLSSSINFITFLAKSSSSFGSQTNPVTPSETTSTIPPLLAAITGHPAAVPSNNTMPNPSTCPPRNSFEGSTKTSNERNTSH